MPGHDPGRAALVLQWGGGAAGGRVRCDGIPPTTSGCAPARQGHGVSAGRTAGTAQSCPRPCLSGCSSWIHRATGIFAMQRLSLAAMRACCSLDAWEIRGRTGRPRPAPASAAGVEGQKRELPCRCSPLAGASRGQQGDGGAEEGAAAQGQSRLSGPCGPRGRSGTAQRRQPADLGAPVRLAWPCARGHCPKADDAGRPAKQK